MENLNGYELDVMSINEKSEIGYFLEVDLKYPDELHDLHNDYPLAPEKLLLLIIYFQNIVKVLLINLT